MSSFTPKIFQGDFDKLVNDIVNEGNSLSEAVTEAVETLTEGGIDLSNIWIYESETEVKIKVQTDERLKAIEKAARSSKSEDFVNATFALGLFL